MTMPEDDLKRRVAAAYDDVLREPVPDRLAQLVASPAPNVVDLQARREQRKGPRFANLTWAQLGGMAASVLVGVIIGLQWPHERGGDVVAGERLARALDSQLAGDTGAVRVQLTFVDRAGRYCRTFSADTLAGLACRDGGQWNVIASAPAEAPAGGGMRQAGSNLPKAVLDAVDGAIAGNALDASQERAARERNWQPR